MALRIRGTMTGNEARNARRGLKMSARELGEAVGVTESSIYRWEMRRERAVPLLFEHALLHVVGLGATTSNGRRAATG